MSEMQRVVVTGFGMVTPLGLDEQTLWENLLAGRTAIRRLTSLDVSEYRTPFGAEVDTPALEARLLALGQRPGDRTADMALVAARAALEQAGLPTDGAPAPLTAQVPVIFGTGMGCVHTMLNAYQQYLAKGLRGIRPTTIPRGMANFISAQISMKYHLTGPNYVTVAACSSSTIALGTAFRLIRHGYAERVLCGGSDSPFDPGMYGAWNNLGVMSRNPDPGRACRPFDAARDGCVLGEGAGALVLESLPAALARGARIRGEILGYGESSDATHITAPDPAGQAHAIRAALADAGLAPDAVGFVNAHATATPANDVCESQSLRLALGDAADRIPVSANKAYFGHLLGAAGVVETLVTLLALETRRLPPNLNLDNQDPACTILAVGKAAQDIALPVALKNSFAFGGDNAVLALRRWNGTTA